MGKNQVIESENPMHEFFGLSYASYLVIPRTLIQSCSSKAQKALREALEMMEKEEAENTGKHWPYSADVSVQLKDPETKRFMKDGIANYERGRRRLW